MNDLDTSLQGLLERVHGGQNVVVACMSGLGRTGTTVACFLREAGLKGDDAIISTRWEREGAIETQEQAYFVWHWRPTEEP